MACLMPCSAARGVMREVVAVCAGSKRHALRQLSARQRQLRQQQRATKRSCADALHVVFFRHDMRIGAENERRDVCVPHR